MFRTSVPKTAINEDGEPLCTEDEVRPAKHRPVTPPTGNAVGSEFRDQPKLGGLVAVRANGRHNGRALPFGKDVSHFTPRRMHLQLTPP